MVGLILTGNFSGSIRELEQQLDISPTTTGANVWVFRPFDEGVNYYKEEIKGKFPNGAEVRVSLFVANELAVFAMKAVAIGQRKKAKDYYDIYMIAKHLYGGPTALGERLGAFKNNKVIVEAAENVRKYFDSPKGLGPTSVADFEGEDDPEAREILQRDVYEVVALVLAEFDKAESVPSATSRGSATDAG